MQFNIVDNSFENILKEINDLEDNKNEEEEVNELEDDGSSSNENDEEINFEDNVVKVYENNEKNEKNDKSLTENIMNEFLLSSFDNLIFELDKNEQKITIDNNIIIKDFKNKFIYLKTKKRNYNESIEIIKGEISSKFPGKKTLKAY